MLRELEGSSGGSPVNTVARKMACQHPARECGAKPPATGVAGLVSGPEYPWGLDLAGQNGGGGSLIDGAFSRSTSIRSYISHLDAAAALLSSLPEVRRRLDRALGDAADAARALECGVRGEQAWPLRPEGGHSVTDPPSDSVRPYCWRDVPFGGAGPKTAPDRESWTADSGGSA